MNFQASRTPELYHGENSLKMVAPLLDRYDGRVLLVTGEHSFKNSPAYGPLELALNNKGRAVRHVKIAREPSPDMIDNAVATCGEFSPGVVIGFGGGSVLDAAKAIAAMIPVGGDVTAFLEGVGTRQHSGMRLPLICLPTTSGTGSEATRNAVISQVGETGFKRSLRHMNFVPDAAILDPLQTLNCPENVTAYSGMDAFTQLLESYLSTAGNDYTDALAWAGLQLVSRSLMSVYRDRSNILARSEMALAAYLSGVSLANAGLGTVHGIAGVIGGFKDIPHGVICSRLMEGANAITIRKLRQTGEAPWALAKYTQVARLFSRTGGQSDDYYLDEFVDTLGEWTSIMNIPKLMDYALTEADLRQFARLSDNKNNPIVLTESERLELLQRASAS